jgi:hypothetical protein
MWAVAKADVEACKRDLDARSRLLRAGPGESPEAVALLERLNAAWDRMTPEEQDEVEWYAYHGGP